MAALALVLAWPSGAQVGGTVTWSSALHLKGLADIPNRLHEPAVGVAQGSTLTNGKVSREVKNCDEYLNAVSAGFHPATNYDAKSSAAFVYQCFVLRDLQHARPATSSNSYRWTIDSLVQLPPVLVVGAREIADAAEQAEKRGESWQQFDPTLRVTKVDGDMLFADDEDFAYSLEILARGDFNGGGKEDIAVYGTAQRKHSTWANCEYFIFSPTNNGKLVRLTDRRAPYVMQVQIPARISMLVAATLALLPPRVSQTRSGGMSL